MEKKSQPELSLKEKSDVLLARADKLTAEILQLPLTEEEKEFLQNILDQRKEIPAVEEGATNENEAVFKKAETAKGDLWDLRKIIFERLAKEKPNTAVVKKDSDERVKELVGMLTEEIFNGKEKEGLANAIDSFRDRFEKFNDEDPSYFSDEEKKRYEEINKKIESLISKVNTGELMTEQEIEDLRRGAGELSDWLSVCNERDRTGRVVHPDALGFKKEQTPLPPRKYEATDYKIIVPEELKEDPEIKNTVALIQKDIQDTLKNKTRVSPEMLESFGRNAETRKWFSFVKNNPEKARVIVEKYGDQFPQIQRAFSKIEVGKTTGIVDEQAEREGLLSATGGAEQVKQGVPVSSSKEKGPASGGNKTNEKDFRAGFDRKSRGILTDDEMRAIAAAEPVAEFSRKRFEREGLRQGVRVVEKLTDETIRNVEANSQQEQRPPAAQGEVIEELGEADIIEQIPYAPKRVIEGFSERGINSDELSKIEGFETLSVGQQLLVLENFRQFSLGRVKEEATLKYNEEKAKSGFFGKVWKGMTKRARLASLEKEEAHKITGDGFKENKIFLEQLVQSIKKQNFEVVERDGNLEVSYVSVADLESRIGPLLSEEREKISDFNRAATQFASMPYEWSLSKAPRENKEEFYKAQGEYENALNDIYNLIDKKTVNDPERSAFYQMCDIRNQVRINQFLNTHPEAENELQKIKTQTAWARGLKDTITEKGIYAGGGFAARGISVSALGLVGLPIAAAGLGGFIAYKRTQEALNEQDIMARKGAGFPKVSELQRQTLKEKSKELAEKEEWLKARFPEYVKAENDYLEEIVKLNKKEKDGEAPTAQEVELLEQLKAKYEKEKDSFEQSPLFQEYAIKRSEYEKIRNEVFGRGKGEEIKKNFVDAKSLVNKIDALVGNLKQEKDFEKAKKFRAALKARLFYIQDKMDKGLISFGGDEERLKNSSDLIDRLNLGHAFVNAEEIFIRDETTKRLEQFLKSKDRKISKAQKTHLYKQIAWGVGLGAAASVGGWVARHLLGGVATELMDISADTGQPTGGGNVLDRAAVIGSGSRPVSFEVFNEALPQAAGNQPIGGGIEAVIPGAPKVESLAQEIQVQPIGKRGPEGAIIDYFKGNKSAARQFGYKDNMNFNKWAGTKAHDLWHKHADEAIKDPEVVSALKKLGYAPEDYIKGYEEMMKHISNGGVKIDVSKGNVDLVDMEYLKFKASPILEDVPTGPQIIEEITPTGPQIDEGIVAVESNAAEAVDNVISTNALHSVEKFAFSDLNFSVGEFSVIKNISVEKLLKEIPSSDDVWAIGREEIEGKSVDLPHYGSYDFTQFRRQVNMAEFIRKIVKEQKIKPEVLKITGIGKFIEKYIAPGLKK